MSRHRMLVLFRRFVVLVAIVLSFVMVTQAALADHAGTTVYFDGWAHEDYVQSSSIVDLHGGKVEMLSCYASFCKECIQTKLSPTEEYQSCTDGSYTEVNHEGVNKRSQCWWYVPNTSTGDTSHIRCRYYDY